jgi:hypothetical protein
MSSTLTHIATSLSSSYYLRDFYIANRSARTSSSRSDYSTNELSLADSQALRRAIKKLGSFDYIDDEDTNIRNSVAAFISTYNNTVSSLSKSDDQTLTHTLKQMKSLTSEYADDLDDIGITVNSSGTLTARESLLSSAALSKFKSLFSEDSDYMQRTNAYRKRAERQSNALVTRDNNAKLLASKKNSSTTSGTAESTNDTTTVAQVLAASTVADDLAANGIGQNVNISL